MRIGLLALLTVVALQAAAERYVTWVDEDGKVRHTRVTEPSESLADPQIVREVRNSPTKPDGQATLGQEAAVASQVPDPTTEAAQPSPSKEVFAGTKAADGRADIDVSDYIDAAELEQRGFVRDGKPAFYTWIDAEGNLRSAPVGAPEKSTVIAVPEQRQHVVVAREQRREASPAPAAADPKALAMLGLDKAPAQRDIDRLAQQCCTQLAELEIDSLRWSNDQIIFFEKDEEMLDLGLGYSVYRLFRLPEDLSEDALFQLRSYIRRNLFSPVVVTLDANLQPVRLLTDLLYVYEKPTWSGHAYMEGYFRVPSVQQEPYLLLFSRHIDQQSTTVVDGPDSEPLLIPHAPWGELFMAVVEE